MDRAQPSRGRHGDGRPGRDVQVQVRSRRARHARHYDEFFGVVEEGVAWFSDPGQGGPPDNDLEVKIPWSCANDGGVAPDAGTPNSDAGPVGDDAGVPPPNGGASPGGCSASPAGASGSSSALALGLVALAFGRSRRRRQGEAGKTM